MHRRSNAAGLSPRAARAGTVKHRRTLVDAALALVAVVGVGVGVVHAIPQDTAGSSPHAFDHGYRNYADLLEEDGDYAGALAAAQEAVAHVRDDGYAFAQLARVAHKMGRSRDAVRFLRHALVVEPYFSEAYCELGSLLLHSRRPQEAAEILEMAKLSHQRPDACRLAILLGLAVSRFRLRQVDRARDVGAGPR